MKKLFIFLLPILLFSCEQESKLKYPETKKQPVVESYFDYEVVDNYRWLEDDLSEETADWVSAQNNVTFGELEKIPFRNALEERLEKLWNYEKIGSPFKEGDYTYFYKNTGLQNQFILYRYKENIENAKVF